jgi:hypothetical protein
MTQAAPHPHLDDWGLLSAWEHGARAGALDRALAVLEAAGHDPGQTEHWPLGRRDAALLDVQARTFGEQLDALTSCPACGEALELRFAVEDLRVPCAEGGEVLETKDARSGVSLRFRVPTSADLRAASAADDDEAACRLLGARCIVAAEDDGRAVAVDELPVAALDALDRALQDDDPQSDLRMAMACPECEHEWTSVLDVGDFVWRQVESRAQSTLTDVATLAAMYGWSEADVLAMTPARRELYLELAG